MPSPPRSRRRRAPRPLRGCLRDRRPARPVRHERQATEHRGGQKRDRKGLRQHRPQVSSGRHQAGVQDAPGVELPRRPSDNAAMGAASGWNGAIRARVSSEARTSVACPAKGPEARAQVRALGHAEAQISPPPQSKTPRPASARRYPARRTVSPRCARHHRAARESLHIAHPAPDRPHGGGIRLRPHRAEGRQKRAQPLGPIGHARREPLQPQDRRGASPPADAPPPSPRRAIPAPSTSPPPPGAGSAPRSPRWPGSPCPAAP
jgi:hypothetical protein